MLSDGNDSLITITREGHGLSQQMMTFPLFGSTLCPEILRTSFLSCKAGYCSILKTEFIRFGDILGQDVAL